MPTGIGISSKIFLLLVFICSIIFVSIAIYFFQFNYYDIDGCEIKMYRERSNNNLSQVIDSDVRTVFERASITKSLDLMTDNTIFCEDKVHENYYECVDKLVLSSSFQDKWANNFFGPISEFFTDEELFRFYEGSPEIPTPNLAMRPMRDLRRRTKPVRIVSCHFNRVDILELQYRSILTYLRDKEWSYVVINTSPKKIGYDDVDVRLYYIESYITGLPIDRLKKMKMHDLIKYVVSQWNDPRVEYIEAHEDLYTNYDVPGYGKDHEKNGAATKCAVSFQFAFDSSVKGHPDKYVAMFDGDVFLGGPLRLNKFFLDGNFAFSAQNYFRWDRKTRSKARINHLTNAVMLFDISRWTENDINTFSFSIKSTTVEGDVGLFLGMDWLPKVASKGVSNYFRHLYPNALFCTEMIVQAVLDPEIREFFLMDLHENFSGDHIHELYGSWWFPDLELVHFKKGGNWDKKGNFEDANRRSRFWFTFWIEKFRREKSPVIF